MQTAHPTHSTARATSPAHAEARAVRNLGLCSLGYDNPGMTDPLTADRAESTQPDWSHPPAFSLPRSTSRVAFWRRQITSAWRFGVICGFVPGLLMGAGGVASLITLGRLFGA